MKKLTSKQKLFCEYYVGSCNIADAAIKAGYTESYAKNKAYELLKQENIAEYIRSLNKPGKENRMADMEEVQELWTEIMRDKENNPNIRLKASELIAKSKGAFLQSIKLEDVTKKNNPFENLTTEELKKIVGL